jgi:hypothetical protein
MAMEDSSRTVTILMETEGTWKDIDVPIFAAVTFDVQELRLLRRRARKVLAFHAKDPAVDEVRYNLTLKDNLPKCFVCSPAFYSSLLNEDPALGYTWTGVLIDDEYDDDNYDDYKVEGLSLPPKVIKGIFDPEPPVRFREAEPGEVPEHGDIEIGTCTLVIKKAGGPSRPNKTDIGWIICLMGYPEVETGTNLPLEAIEALLTRMTS